MAQLPIPDLYKATWFIAYGRGGFSFSHYKIGTSHQQVMVDAQIVAHDYLLCCGTSVELPYIRVSREDTLGDSVVTTQLQGTIDLLNPNQPGNPPPGPTVPRFLKPSVPTIRDVWWTSALLRLGCTPSIRGRQFMRGIPDAVVSTPTRGFLDVNFEGAVAVYMLNLCQNAWGVAAVPSTTSSRIGILSIVRAAGGDVTITTNGNHNFVVGSDFRLSRFGPQLASISPNGKWVADVGTTGNVIKVLAYQGMAVPTTYRRAGQVWSLQKAFFRFDPKLCKLVRVTRRKAGAPFGQLVGKQKTHK